MDKPSGLGKGLDALIPKKISNPNSSEQTFEVSVNAIRPNPHQPRKEFRSEELDELVSSIKQHGILQPLVVTKVGDGYELIAGERRLRAAKAAGLARVPVIVREALPQAKLELSLIENLQRQDLNSIEQAKAYATLNRDFHLSHEDIARRVGKHRTVISNTIRLLDLPSDIQEAVVRGVLVPSAARALLALEAPEQRRYFDEIMGGAKITSRDIEKKSPARRQVVDPNLTAAEAKLRELLATKVTITKRAGRGAIAIEFYSDEEFRRILDRLMP